MATSTTISGLTALGGAPATGDLLVLVDISDTVQAVTGTDKKMTVANLFTSPHLTTVTIDSGGLTVTAGGATIVGNSGVTGTLTVTGNLTIGSGAFTIDAATGNTSVGGTLGVVNSVVFQSTISAAGLPTSAGAAGTLWVDGSGFVKRA